MDDTITNARRKSPFLLSTYYVLPVALFAITLLLPYTITSFLLTGDLRDVFLPLEDFYRQELAAGRMPLWNPNTAMGFPALASSQIGFWYPPLLALRVLPPEPALAVAYLLHGIFLAAGVYLYSRSLSTSRTGALLAATAFTGSGFVIGHLTHANILFGITWLPWVLLCADKLAQTLRPRFLLLTSLGIALSALPGHFHIAAIILAFAGVRLWSGLRAHQRGATRAHTVWTFALLLVPILALTTLLTAAQLLPTLELALESSRGPGGSFDLDRANQHSFPPWQAITFFLPAFFGFPDLSEYWGTRPLVEMAAWIGVLPFLLALVGIASSLDFRKRQSARPYLFWTVTAIAGFLLALGRWSPFRFVGLEPTLGIFSSPARYLLLTQFSLAILAGFGLDRLQTTSRRLTRFVGALSLAAAALIAGGFVVLRTFPESVQRLGEYVVDRLIVGRPEHVLSRAAYSEKVAYLLSRLSTWGVNLRNPSIALSFLLLSGGSIVLIVSSRRSAIIRDSIPAQRSAVAVVIVLATAVELIVIGWQAHPRIPWPEVSVKSPIVAALKDRPWGRLYAVHPPGDTGLVFASPTTTSRDAHERLLRDLAVANIPTRAGIPGIEWPASLDLATASRVLGNMRDDQGRPINERLADRLGVRYISGSTATANLTLLRPARELLSFVSGDGATVRLWERPTARPRVEVLAAKTKDITEKLPPVVGTAMITAETTRDLAISVENPSDHHAALILRDTFYPGWHATLDGQRAPIERADTLFRGLIIPPGAHMVTFSYQPWTTRTGILISTLAWLFAVTVLSQRTHRNA